MKKRLLTLALFGALFFLISTASAQAGPAAVSTAVRTWTEQEVLDLAGIKDISESRRRPNLGKALTIAGRVLRVGSYIGLLYSAVAHYYGRLNAFAFNEMDWWHYNNAGSRPEVNPGTFPLRPEPSAYWFHTMPIDYVDRGGGANTDGFYWFSASSHYDSAGRLRFKAASSPVTGKSCGTSIVHSSKSTTDAILNIFSNWLEYISTSPPCHKTNLKDQLESSVSSRNAVGSQMIPALVNSSPAPGRGSCADGPYGQVIVWLDSNGDGVCEDGVDTPTVEEWGGGYDVADLLPETSLDPVTGQPEDPISVPVDPYEPDLTCGDIACESTQIQIVRLLEQARDYSPSYGPLRDPSTLRGRWETLPDWQPLELTQDVFVDAGAEIITTRDEFMASASERFPFGLVAWGTELRALPESVVLDDTCPVVSVPIAGNDLNMNVCDNPFDGLLSGPIRTLLLFLAWLGFGMAVLRLVGAAS